MTDIGPEFLQHVKYAVERDLRCPFLAGFCPCALLPWVIEVGNACSGAVTNNLREVESLTASVGAGDEEPADRVARTFDVAPMVASIVAGIFTRCGGHNEFREVVAYGLIGKRVPEIAGVTCAPLMELRSLIFRLADSCREPCDQQRRVVKAVLSSKLKLTLERERR